MAQTTIHWILFCKEENFEFFAKYMLCSIALNQRSIDNDGTWPHHFGTVNLRTGFSPRP